MQMLRGIFAREWAEHPDLDREADPPAADRLEQVAVPTSVVNGQLDVSEIQDVAGLVCAGVPDAHHVDVADTTHLSPLERPEQVNSAISDFLVTLRW